MSAWPDDPTLEDIQAEFQGWYCYRDISGLYCATRGTVTVRGEDPMDLRDQIIRQIRLAES